MKKIIAIIFCLLLFPAAGKCESSEQAYRLYMRSLKAEAGREAILDQLIDLYPDSGWAGWAKLEKLKDSILSGSTAYPIAEKILLKLIDDYGKQLDPTGGVFRVTTGGVDMQGEVRIKKTVKAVPVYLESSCRLVLAGLHLKFSESEKAKNHLKLLIDDGTLARLKSEFGKFDPPQYFYYPQQLALRMLFDLAVKEGNETEALDYADQITNSGFPADATHVETRLKAKRYER